MSRSAARVRCVEASKSLLDSGYKDSLTAAVAALPPASLRAATASSACCLPALLSRADAHAYAQAATVGAAQMAVQPSSS